MRLTTKVRNRALTAFGEAYDRVVAAFPRADISDWLRSAERRAALSYDQTPRLNRLVQEPLHYLDAGARSGPPRLVSHYSRFIAATLVEPEPVEASRLRGLGYSVVEKALGAGPGRTELHVTAQPGASSVRKPNRFIESYLERPDERARNWAFEERRDVVRVEQVDVTTVADLSRELGTVFDWFKIDVQGAEHEVLMGLGDQRPLFITTEVSLVQYYEDQRTFYDVAKLLYELGYLMYSFEVPSLRPGTHSARQPTLPGLPLHGDVAFMPDWSRKEGQALMVERSRSFAALALILGLEEVLRYVASVLPLQEAAAIADALSVPVAERFMADGFSAPR